MKVKSGRSLDARGYLRGVDSAQLPALTSEVRRLLHASTLHNGRRSKTSADFIGLSIALQRVFDPQVDRILWEEESAGAFRMTLIGRDIHVDGPHVLSLRLSEGATHAVSEKTVASLRAGDALTTAFGLLHARKKFHDQYWIIVVVERQWFCEHLSPVIIENLREVDSQFLLIVHDERKKSSPNNGTNGSHGKKTPVVQNRLIDQDLSELGMPYLGPISGNDTEQLVSQLEQIHQRGSTALLHIDATGETTSQQVAEPTPAELTPELPEKPKIQRQAPLNRQRFGFSEESLQRELDLIEKAELSADVEEWFNLYSQVGFRSRFLWKWCVHGAELTTISCVMPQWRRHVCDTKILSIMLCVLLDDVADEQGNEDLLEVLLQIVQYQTVPEMDGFSAEDRKYAQITLKLSEIYESRVVEYPLYKVYKRLLDFDLLQYFNTMRYSCLLNHNLHLLNVTEHELYLPHAMHMMSFSTLDLMCTPDFEAAELGRFREAIWHAQCMGRVGNLLSTWEREIDQEDFTSGVFARAITQGDLIVEQLKVGNAPLIENAIIDGNHEQYFLKKWREHRECFKTKLNQIKSVDLANFVESQERFFQMHLACRGSI